MKKKNSIFAYLFCLLLILAVPLAACSRGSSSSDSNSGSSSSSGSSVAAAGSSSSAAASSSQGQSSSSAHSKILVAYFSQTNHTRTVANLIHQQVGGDLFRIEPAVPYPADMQQLVNRKNRELATGHMPKLKEKVKNIKDYDVVFLGYPIWSSTTPPPIHSFIQENDLSGKTIVPFCTNDGYGPGSSVDSIKQLLPAGTKVLDDVLSIRGADAAGAGPNIHSWLQKIGIPSK